ncbi:oxidoreductase [Kineococcus sp. T13]|uniref:GMC family oxidoreductase N-terminal domain-containing protein n=1 Tax=Kineococcus vitellinus TaxID=2696565 RepID=UPI0014137655|nr:oxidoreductase [Kineococcus vitellinus]
MSRTTPGAVPSYDTVVVGAGSAGSVITRRLVDAGQRVLLLEAGGEDLNPAIHDVGRLGELWHGPEDWGHFTTPQEHALGRRLHLPRGKVVGGSHALNATIYVRGHASDYDAWAAAGCTGWGWRDVLPAFKAIEDYDGGASELRGKDGLLDVVGSYPLAPIQASIVQAAQQVGIPFNPDYNAGELDGISQQQITVRDGRRLSTYTAYVRPVLDSPALEVVTGAHVHRLLLEGGRVVGLEYEVGGRLVRQQAGRIVLSAGAIGSPRLLLLSGIGPAAELEAVGVRPVLDLPGVGKNLHDHFLSPVIFATGREIAPPAGGASVTQTHLFARSRPELEVPDTQPIHFSVPMYEPWMQGPSSGFSLMAGLIRPHSRGELRLSGSSPHDELLIDPAALSEEADLQALAFSVAQCRRIGAAPALAEEWGARELYPGAEVDSEEAVREYVRRTVITYHHQVGTCRMGVDEMAVVDPCLAVHGVQGLHVADASIMPRITSGNTNAPSIMIGEKAAAALTS